MEGFIPDYDDVMEIHHELVALFRSDSDPIEPPGARDENLVHSACSRPHTSLGVHEKYVDDYSKLAALFHSLTQNHAFHNGNKRTALVSLLAGLYRSGRILKYDVGDDDIYEMTVAVARGGFLNINGRIDADAAVSAISHWLRQNSVSRNVAPSDMRATDFIAQCRSMGCSVRSYKGGQLVSHGARSVRIGGDTRQLAGRVAKKYLGILGLSQADTGQTFAEFQNVEDAERTAIYRYMDVLRRLAKI